MCIRDSIKKWQETVKDMYDESRKGQNGRRGKNIWPPDNWSWRMEEGELTHSLKNKLAELTRSHRRNGSAIKNLLKKETESWK